MITVRSVPADHPDAHLMWSEQEADLRVRYDAPDVVMETEFPDLIASLVAYAEDGAPVGAIVVHWSPYHEAGAAELKRLWVRAGHRGNGHSRVLVGAAEAAARRAGATRIVLESGDQQPEANRLYASSRYSEIPPYGRWVDEGNAHYWGRSLATRVLVVNGTMGAGKTAVASAALDLLSDRGARAAFIDADALAQAEPTPPQDPFNEALAFEGLRAIAPAYRKRGYGCIVVARVVEDPEDRTRYAHAFASDAGAADVSIVRLDAPEDVRFDRLTAREPEGRWREFSLERSAELDDILRTEDLDDAVLDNDGSRSAIDVASDALDAVGW